jgi:hypothetical protein
MTRPFDSRARAGVPAAPRCAILGEA